MTEIKKSVITAIDNDQLADQIAKNVKMEVAEELLPLENQLSQIQQIFSKVQNSQQANATPSGASQNQQQQVGELVKQMNQFSSQIQNQQKQTMQQLQQSIQQATQILTQASQGLQSFQMLNQMQLLVQQSQQQANQMSQQAQQQAKQNNQQSTPIQ